MKTKSFVMLLVLTALLGAAAGWGGSELFGKGGAAESPSLAQSGQLSEGLSGGRTAAGQQVTSPADSAQSGSDQQGTEQTGSARRGQFGLGGLGPSSGGGSLGTVQKVEGYVITLVARDGTTVTARVSDATSIQKTVAGSIADIREGVAVTVSGERLEDGSLKATAVSVGTQSAGLTGAFGAGGAGGSYSRGTPGTALKVEGSMVTLSLGDGTEQDIIVSDETSYQKTVRTTIADVAVGGTILVVGETDAGGSMIATSISIMSGITGLQGTGSQ